MKTLKQLREQTLNEAKKWSWDGRDEDEWLDNFDGHMIKTMLDCGSYATASTITYHVFHYMDGLELSGSGVAMDESPVNSKGQEPSRKLVNGEGTPEGDAALDAGGYTFLTLEGPPEALKEFLTLKGSEAWPYLKDIPSSNIKKALSKARRFTPRWHKG